MSFLDHLDHLDRGRIGGRPARVSAHSSSARPPAIAHCRAARRRVDRRAWILSILVFGDSASKAFTRLAGEVGKGLGEKATKRIPLSVLRGINSSVGRTILTKYGTKRGVIALGTALPLGIGAVVGGSTNYAAVRLLARHANKFFANLPYTAILEIEAD